MALQPAYAQFDPVFDLRDLNGQNGFTLIGLGDSDYLGYSVSSAGDINDDGIDDFITSAPNTDTNGFTSNGSSYVVFGSHSPFPPLFDHTSLDGSNGFTLHGLGSRHWNGIVSEAGDINGDGIDDVIIGAVGASPGGNGGAGKSYVVFGSNSPFPPVFDLASLDGSNGFALHGVGGLDGSGGSVSEAGDINNDGIDDLIIGAPRARMSVNNRFGDNHRTGNAYVVFGSLVPFPPLIKLSSLDGSNGFTINGVSTGDMAGACVSAAGDVNGDGIDDILIGAHGTDSDGSSYIIFGSNNPFPPIFDLSSIDGSNGFTINESGCDAAGDVNGDGIDDIIISSPYSSPGGNIQAGVSYVVFGSSSSLPHPLDLSTLNGINGFSINGVSTYDRSGSTANAAGDVNGDGIDDIIIGAEGFDTNEWGDSAGRIYVVFGSNSSFTPVFNLSSINGMNGFALMGGGFDSNFGHVGSSSAGDVNGDGINDLIMGAPLWGDFKWLNFGSTFVVFGKEKPLFSNGFE